jgi:hypothetical protein
MALRGPAGESWRPPLSTCGPRAWYVSDMLRTPTFCAALAALALTANGASAIYIVSVQPLRVHIPPTKPHEIEVNSFQWGIGRGIGSPTGGSADRAGKSTVGNIHISNTTLCRHCSDLVVPPTK